MKNIVTYPIRFRIYAYAGCKKGRRFYSMDKFNLKENLERLEKHLDKNEKWFQAPEKKMQQLEKDAEEWNKDFRYGIDVLEKMIKKLEESMEG